jgi:hypothetical protein
MAPSPAEVEVVVSSLCLCHSLQMLRVQIPTLQQPEKGGVFLSGNNLKPQGFKRTKGFEPSTFSLATRHSTAELRSHCPLEQFLSEKAESTEEGRVELPRLLHSTIFKIGSVANRIALPFS